MKIKNVLISSLLILLIILSVSAISATDINSNNQDQISSEGANDEIAIEEIDKDISAKSQSDGVNIGNNKIRVSPSSDGTSDAASIQKAIENSARPGDTILLNDRNFTLEKPISLTKDLTINGGSIYNSNNLSDLITIVPVSEGGPKKITITGTTFYVNGNENIVLAEGNIIGNGITQIANITVSNCKILPINSDVNTTNSKLVKVQSDNASTLTTGTISVQNNDLQEAQSLNINNVLNYTDNTFYRCIIILDTEIEANDISIYVRDKNMDEPNYLAAKLIDANGNPVAGQTLNMALAGNSKNATTDENGTAKFAIGLSETDYAYITYLGQEGAYNGADMKVVAIKVSKKTTTITAKKYTYNVNAKTKKISVTVKDQNGKLVVSKAVSITVNGKTYSTKTNSKGVATATVTLNKKGTYTYTAKVTGNSVYKEVSKKGSLVINGLASALTVKNYNFKRYATKKIKVTLKSGKTVLKNKKITVKINGKTYSAKTNSKGIATISIKLTKKGTFTYTAKFAGDNTYKATSKSAKVVIK